MDRVTVERAALIALLRQPDLGWSDAVHDIQEVGTALAVLRRVVGQTDTLFPDTRSVDSLIEAAAGDLAGWRAEGITVRAFFDDDYPAQLRDIREMPPVLFARGESRPDARAIAVVGSREASDRGVEIASSVSESLARRGVTVVSGLAKGIDTAAHQAALAAGGRTVAVIGTGIRHHYPTVNHALQEHIAKVGLVLSQFWPDAAPTKQSFPMRNAVMSGYAAATVVIEAGERSGARIQARLALQHGRPVVLTSQVMRHDWARAFATRPGVHVAHGTMDLVEAVDAILDRSPAAAELEGFPDFASL
ncbi:MULTISPECIES: DNA-processing protein DprA [Micromonospora]|uniref:DNA-processing protein DprA n=1 Tax=Micromonospora TaxID=1873 RepID=UPI001EE91AB3|nr:DNA-processing protein DprA [Micromonospora hortensis]MCG5450170.1 DNA-protecting protein DprA [Micromonospora hortensis]WTI09481.1 DNA-protecting protein DprA [Micromonospora sp. NBC_00821]